MNNCKGQALLESLVALPFILGAISAIFITLYSMLGIYLLDHWSYQSTLCLAKEISKSSCQNQLRQRVSILPFFKISQIQMNKGFQSASTKISSQLGPFIDKEIRNYIRLPLNSEDFERAGR